MEHRYDIGYEDGKGYFVTRQSELRPIDGRHFLKLLQAEEARWDIEYLEANKGK